MNTKMKNLVGVVALKFPDESERWHKEVAKGLCKSHKAVFEEVMLEIKSAVEENRYCAHIQVEDVDNIVRGKMIHTSAWEWSILNTREHLIKVMTRFEYEISVDSGLFIITWDKGKHHDYSKES